MLRHPGFSQIAEFSLLFNLCIPFLIFALTLNRATLSFVLDMLYIQPCVKSSGFNAGMCWLGCLCGSAASDTEKTFNKFQEVQFK